MFDVWKTTATTTSTTATATTTHEIQESSSNLKPTTTNPAILYMYFTI